MTPFVFHCFTFWYFKYMRRYLIEFYVYCNFLIVFIHPYSMHSVLTLSAWSYQLGY